VPARLRARSIEGTERALLLALALLASCSRCGAPAARDAAELLPANYAAALQTAPLGTLAARESGFSQLAAQIPGGEIVGDTARALSGQLGVDLLSREGLLAAGLDPERGAAVMQLAAVPATAPATATGAPPARAPWIAAVPLSSAEKFGQRLESVLAGRAGYPLRADEPRGNVHCVVFSRTGSPTRIGYALVRGYGVIAVGADPAGLIAEAAARPAEQSLARDPRLARAQSELEHPDLLLLSAAGNPLLARLGAIASGLTGGLAGDRGLPGNSALGVALFPDGARLQLAQDLTDAHRDQLRALFVAAAPADAFQTPQAPLELKTSALPSQLPTLLAQLPLVRDALPGLRAAFAKQGADLDRDLFGALSPGAAFALGLAPNANLGRALDPALLDVRLRSPFDIVRFYAASSARDPEAIRRAFTALASALPALGATAQRTAEKKQAQGGLLDEWTTRYPGGEGVRFGLFVPGRDLCGQAPAAHTQALVFALGGAGSLEEVLAARLPCARAALGDSARSGDVLHANDPRLADAGAAPMQLQLDLGALADAVNQLPDSAYGTGPQVFVARSLVSQVILPLQRLRASAELRPSDRGFLATVRVHVAAAPGAAGSDPARAEGNAAQPAGARP